MDLLKAKVRVILETKTCFWRFELPLGFMHWVTHLSNPCQCVSIYTERDREFILSTVGAAVSMRPHFTSSITFKGEGDRMKVEEALSA